MRWFKHDSDANSDAKLKRVRIKYGLEGYGLYWYCLELIASDVSKDKITFELEHDAEIIAHDTGIHYQRVQEMMTFMVNLGLFQQENGIVRCIKMAQRIDQSMTSNPEMRKIIESFKAHNHDAVMIESVAGHDAVMPKSCKPMQDKTRLDENRTQDLSPTGSASVNKKVDSTPYDLIVDSYHEHLPMMPAVRKLTDTRRRHIRARWAEVQKADKGLTYFEEYFDYVAGSSFLTTGTFDLEWLMKEANHLKVTEGKYHNE